MKHPYTAAEPKIGERATCLRCGQEVEWVGVWHDRGGNTCCGSYKGRDGEIVQENHTRPHIVSL